jgi:hypothetical protein
MTGDSRYTHLVGGLTAGTALEAMTTMLDSLGPSLLSVPDGENPTAAIPQREQWIRPELQAAAGLPGVKARNSQASDTRYSDSLWWEATQPLTAADWDSAVIMETAFQESYPVFAGLRRDRGLTGLRFQAGVISAVDLAVRLFRDAGLREDLLGPIAEAKARQVRACHEQAPGDLVCQLESPIGTKMVADADDPAETAAYVAGLLTSLPRRCPGTAWGVHLCDGDWGHKAQTHPASALPLVLLASEIAARWPDGPDAPVLEYIHLPFAAADQPPATDAAWYKPLAGLKLPPGCRLAAGFVHELTGLPELRSLLGIIEDAYGAEVTIAATCGLVRRPPGQAADALEKTAALAGV